tara:strand:+ start:247 stop:423 length:177 start_codon:yes stop_codon:yes gene_type:complete
MIDKLKLEETIVQLATKKNLKKYFINFEQVIKKLSSLINQKKIILYNAAYHSEMKRIN